MSQKMIRNRYRILQELGRGGMGSVFLAEDRLTNRTVALKRVLIPTENLQFSIANTASIAGVVAQLAAPRIAARSSER